MNARISSHWQLDEEELLNTAFATLAVTWPRTQREDLAQLIADSLFPTGDQCTPWEIVDLSSTTKDNVSNFKMFIRLHDSPSAWFQNLRILQVRVKLGLDDAYGVAQEMDHSRIGTLAAKLEAVQAIIGTQKLMDCSTPTLKRKSTTRDFPNISNVRALSLREVGLRT